MDVFSVRFPQQMSHYISAAIFNCRKPSIVALNGAAVGVGITMTLPCDVRIAASGARIGFVFARRGLVPEAGSASRYMIDARRSAIIYYNR